MPRTDRMDEAINNLHAWAKKKRLRRADCGCCYYNASGVCEKNRKQLKSIEVVIYGKVSLRCDECDEFEKHAI